MPGGVFNLYNSATTPAGQSVTVQLNGSTSGNSFFNTGGNVGIGTTTPGTAYANTKLEVNGYIQTDAGIYFPGNPTPQTVPWTGVVCGGDYAESVDVHGDKMNYGPGDVLVIGAEDGSDVVKSSQPYSTLVAGIYATKPELLVGGN